LLFSVKSACADAKKVFLDWSFKDPKYTNDKQKISVIWDSAKVGDGDNFVTIATLYKYLSETDINFKDLDDKEQEVIYKPCTQDTDIVLCHSHWKLFYFVGSWNCFYSLSLKKTFKVEAFNAMFPSEEKKGSATIFLKSLSFKKHRVAHAQYSPYSPRRFEIAHLPILNTWAGNYPVKRIFDIDKIAFWFDHISYLFNNNSTYIKHFHDYCAALFQRKQRRLNFALVICSLEEGIGKTTPLTELFHARFGTDNVGSLTNDNLSEKYNFQIVEKEVVIFEDADAAGRFDVVNKLKPWLSDAYISCTRKYYDSEKVKNYAAHVILTNNMNSLAITKKSRRFLVLKCDAKPRGADYIEKLLSNLKKYVDEIVQYYLHYEIDLIKFAQRAPRTEAATEMMLESAPLFVRLITDIKEEYKVPYIDEFLTLKPFYDTFFFERSWTHDTTRIGNALKFLGYKAKFQMRDQDGRRYRIYSMTDEQPDSDNFQLQLEFLKNLEI
jgi:hypothetical protein